jgi:hypothetical protein
MSVQMETKEAQVLIVGAGPVGLTLALDLAWRGVDVTIAECRPAHEPPSVKCGQISARSMEIFRRLGIADKLRKVGLPPDFPNDVVSGTTATGIELSRPAVDVTGVAEVAARRGVPLSILDLEESSAHPPYHHKVVLVRPDQHVAWRGDEAPADPMELIDLVRGARTASVSRPAP